MRRPRRKLEVNTFPFLAVLLCAMGAFILLLMVVNRRSKIVAQNKAQDAYLARKFAQEADRESAVKDRDAKMKANWQVQKDKIHAELKAEEDALSRQITMVLAALAKTDDAIENRKLTAGELARKVALEDVALQALQKELLARKDQFERVRQTSQGHLKLREQLTRDLVLLETALRNVQERKSNQRAVFSLVPYKGKHGSAAKPVYIEVADAGVAVHPGPTTLTTAALSPDSLRRAVEERTGPLAREVIRKPGAPIPEKSDSPYLLFLVRPSGVENYYLALQSLRDYQVDFGYELVEADWAFDFSNDKIDQQPWRQVAKVDLEPSHVTRAAPKGMGPRVLGDGGAPIGFPGGGEIPEGVPPGTGRGSGSGGFPGGGDVPGGGPNPFATGRPGGGTGSPGGPGGTGRYPGGSGTGQGPGGPGNSPGVFPGGPGDPLASGQPGNGVSGGPGVGQGPGAPGNYPGGGNFLGGPGNPLANGQPGNGAPGGIGVGQGAGAPGNYPGGGNFPGGPGNPLANGQPGNGARGGTGVGQGSGAPGNYPAGGNFLGGPGNTLANGQPGNGAPGGTGVGQGAGAPGNYPASGNFPGSPGNPLTDGQPGNGVPSGTGVGQGSGAPGNYPGGSNLPGSPGNPLANGQPGNGAPGGTGVGQGPGAPGNSPGSGNFLGSPGNPLANGQPGTGTEQVPGVPGIYPGGASYPGGPSRPGNGPSGIANGNAGAGQGAGGLGNSPGGDSNPGGSANSQAYPALTNPNSIASLGLPEGTFPGGAAGTRPGSPNPYSGGEPGTVSGPVEGSAANTNGPQRTAPPAPSNSAPPSPDDSLTFRKVNRPTQTANAPPRYDANSSASGSAGFGRPRSPDDGEPEPGPSVGQSPFLPAGRPAPGPRLPALGRIVGNRDFIMTVECFERSVSLSPPGRTFDLNDPEAVEKLAAVVKTLVAGRQRTVRPGEPPFRPIVQFRVQPDGRRTYYSVYPRLAEFGFAMSRESAD